MDLSKVELCPRRNVAGQLILGRTLILGLALKAAQEQIMMGSGLLGDPRNLAFDVDEAQV